MNLASSSIRFTVTNCCVTLVLKWLQSNTQLGIVGTLVLVTSIIFLNYEILIVHLGNLVEQVCMSESVANRYLKSTKQMYKGEKPCWKGHRLPLSDGMCGLHFEQCAPGITKNLYFSENDTEGISLARRKLGDNNDQGKDVAVNFELIQTTTKATCLLVSMPILGQWIFKLLHFSKNSTRCSLWKLSPPSCGPKLPATVLKYPCTPVSSNARATRRSRLWQILTWSQRFVTHYYSLWLTLETA